jgi:hypothetical protein
MAVLWCKEKKKRGQFIIKDAFTRIYLAVMQWCIRPGARFVVTAQEFTFIEFSSCYIYQEINA